MLQGKCNSEQVLWMADCYSLAKKFPDPKLWLKLLEPIESCDPNEINPFHYWLWMEIWKAAQVSKQDSGKVLVKK